MSLIQPLQRNTSTTPVNILPALWPSLDITFRDLVVRKGPIPDLLFSSQTLPPKSPRCLGGNMMERSEFYVENGKRMAPEGIGEVVTYPRVKQ
jgi:hypothetical protein